MKKLLLLSAILIGAASASQAGGIHFGFSFPLPTPPRVVISPPAPVVVAQSECYTPQVVVTPPICEPQVVVRDRYVYRNGRRPFLAANKWDRHPRYRR